VAAGLAIERTSALRSFINGNCLPGERSTAGSRPLAYFREFKPFFLCDFVRR
jgi:hypothetical protein